MKNNYSNQNQMNSQQCVRNSQFTLPKVAAKLILNSQLATRNSMFATLNSKFSTLHSSLLALTLFVALSIGNVWGQCTNTGTGGTACAGAGGTTVATISTTGSVTIDAWQTQSATNVSTTLTWIFSGVTAGTTIQLASCTGNDSEITITGPVGFATLQVDGDTETSGLGCTPNANDETATIVCTVDGEYRVRLSRHSTNSCLNYGSGAATRYLYWRVRGRTAGAFTISGPSNPCVNVSQTYTAGAGSGSEVWTFPANFTGSGNAASVTRTPTSTTSGTISCTRQIGCGAVVSATNTISVTPVTAPTASAGGALSAICPGATSAQMGGSATGAGGALWSGGAGSWTNATNASTATYTAGASESGSITLTLTSSAGNCSNATATKTIVVHNTSVGWGNLETQNGTICASTGTHTVRGRVWKDTYTNPAGADPNFEVQIGYSSSNTNPSGVGWTWSAATWFEQTGNDDRYTGNLTGLAAGTYYYSIRYRYCSTGSWFYGGYSGGGGGAWNGTTNINGVLTVNAAPTANAGSALSNICRGTSTAQMGGSVGGGATGATWSGGSGSWTNPTNASTAVYNAAANESGTITLTLTATAPTGCTNVTATKNLTFTAVSAAPTITGPICPGNTTVSGTGVNGSTIKVIRSGSEIQSGSATWSGSNWSITVSSVSSGESLTATQTESGKCVSDASSAYVVITPASWGEISSPSSGISICGSTQTIYGQVYRAGTTEAAGQGASLTADLGWSSTNTNPNTWSNWTSATFHTQQGNNDQFSASLGAGLTQGTWYYAFRYSYAGCPIYGGYGGVYGSGGSNGTATVPASQSATLSSAVGTNAQTVCKGTAITNITYSLANGANNASLTSGSLPTGVSGSVSGGVLTISGTPSASGVYTYTFTTSGTSNCAFTFTGTITVSETLDWANLQFPSTAAICVGGNASIYGKVYESGVTEFAGAGAGITAQYGYSSSNSDPSGVGWTWGSASFNAQQTNDDEFVGTFGSSLTAGTYYYTMRFTYNGCTVYGGFNAGPWNGTTNVNGTLTVNALPAITGQPSTPTATCSGSGTQTMTVTATGAGLTYQWRKGGVNISNGGVFSGATSATLTLTNPTTSDAGSYDCVVSGTCTPSVTSNAITVTVNAIPTITGTTPASRCGSGTVALGATASAGTINWYAAASGGTSLATGTSYTTPSLSSTTTYYVDATSSGCTTGSRTAIIATVNDVPTITGTTPNSRCGTGTVALSATASAGTINWYAAASGGASSGTGTSYTSPSISTTTTYYVDATANGCTTAARTAVTATVNAVPTVTFTAQPGATGCTNADVTYTTQSGQSSYVWTVPGTLNTDYSITSGGIGSSSNTVTLKWLTTGSKTVSVNYSNASGCSATAATSSTATTVSAAPTVNAGADFNMCSGQTVAMNASTNATSTSTSASATYSSGNASTLYSASPTTATISSCPIPLSVTIPVGAVITGVNVAYSMTAASNGWRSDQRSYVRCTNVGGIAESAISSGSGTGTGTVPYSRNNLTIANGVSGGGTINFELHAFRTFSGTTCATTDNFVNNNSFIITVNYTLNPTYSWSPATGLSSTNVLNPNSSATTTTTYTLTVTGTNGCSATDQVVATVAGSAPAAPTVTATAAQINVGGTAAFSASGSNVTWYDAATGGNVLGTGSSYTSAVRCTAGSTLTVYAEDNNGTCSSATRGSASVTVRSMVVDNPSNGLICTAGGSVTLSTQLTGGSSITWSPNTNLSTTSGASTIASPTVTTVYTMNATVTGCGAVSETATVGVIEGVAFTPTSNPTAVCAGGTATLASNLTSSGFTYSTTTFSLASPSSPTNLASAGVASVALTSGTLDDGGWQNIPIGFSYNFFGNNYTTLNVGTNGVVQFGTYNATSLGDYSYATSFPTATEPTNVIAAGANDFYATSGTIRYWIQGTAPTRIFVVEWNAIPGYVSGTSSSQIKLFETTGNVEIHIANNNTVGYGSITNKVVGLQNADASVGATAYSNTGTITNTAWKFVPGANYTFQWSTAGSNIGGATSTTFTTPALSTPGTVSYTVAATNPNTQCASTGTVSVTVNALPSAPVSAGNVTECGNAANQNLVVSVGSGETADWYAASSGGSILTTPSNGTGVTSYSVPANATATYYAQARNTTTGCISSSRTGVTFTTKPVPTAPTASAVSYCQGATSSPMTASTPVGSNTQNWYTVSTGGTPLAGAPTPSTSTATTLTYYVAEVGTNGCESSRTSVTATINASPATPTGISASRCGTGTVSLGVETSINGTIKWYSDAGLTNLLDSYANCTTPNPCTTNWTTPSISSTTVYYATKTNVAGCQSLGVAVTATVNPDITASVSNSASSTSACGGGSITFTATPTNGGASPSYQWYLNGSPVTNETNATYTLASPNNADAIYVAMTPSAQTCLTSSSATNSNTVTLTSTASTPTVSIQSSASSAICPGSSVTFSVNSSTNMGATPSYVWKLNGSPISSATNATYTSTGLANNDQITLEMTSSLNGLCLTQPSATSSAITTTVNTATSITAQPSATSACASGTANFTVTGAGQGTLTYQWKKNGANVTGNGTATSATLTLSGVGAGDVANYNVDVTGACGTVSSNTAAFTLKTPTSISVHPSAVTTCTNTNANFSVTAAGQGTLSYQWTFGGSPINTATNSSYTATGVTSANAGSYRVIVTGECGALTSNAAALTVQPATVISSQPSASTICQNNTANFAVSATGQGTLSYQWKRDGTNVGTNSSSLSVSNAQSANAGTYTVDVTGDCGTTTSNAAVLTVNPATAITTQPVGTSGCEGQNTTFTVVAAGTGSLSYQWKYGATNVGTNSASFNIPSTTTANDGNYSVVVSGGCGNATSNTVALNVYPSPTTTATISTADITDATLCGKNTVSVVANSPGAESVGSWSVVGGFDITPANASATSTTFTASNSALGGQAKKLVWSHIRSTSGNNCFTRDTITVDFKQPSFTAISAVVEAGDVLWNGLTDANWSTSSNWYLYTVTNNVGSWIRMTTGEPSSSTKVYTLSNNAAGVCVNSSNAPALGNGETAGNVYVGEGATLNLSNGSLALTGDFTNNGSINPNTGNVRFTGTANQKIKGTGLISNFNNVIVDKESGTVTLEQPVQIKGTLTMTKGNIVSDVTNILEIGASTSVLGSIDWTSGTVVGPMKRWFASTANSSGNSATDKASGIFPVGTSTRNRYAQINFTGNSGDGSITVEFKLGAPPSSYNLPLAYVDNGNQYIQNTDSTGYWEIIPSEYGSGIDVRNYNIILRINNDAIGENPVTANPPGMRIIRAKGSNSGHSPFELLSTTASFEEYPGSLSGTDYLVSVSAVQGFSWFNVGGDNESPLPVSLLSFSGECLNDSHIINWSTASEHNSESFEIQVSRDGTSWNTISTMAAAGNSNSLINYNYVNENAGNDAIYYRLRQLDNNGDEKMYDPIFVSCTSTEKVLLSFPNPSSSSFKLLVNDEDFVGEATVVITDSKGMIVAKQDVQITDGTNMILFEEQLPSGMYYLQIKNGRNSSKVLKHSIR